jgi:hypothetical protein
MLYRWCKWSLYKNYLSKNGQIILNKPKGKDYITILYLVSSKPSYVI